MTAASKVTAFELISNALDVLEKKVTVKIAAANFSHTSLEVAGLDNPEVVAACARFLIGFLAGAIGLDAKLGKSMMIDASHASAELGKQCLSLLGPDNKFDTDETQRFRDQRRNAWIAEGVAHALLVARAKAVNDLVPGAVLAVNAMHPIPSAPGLDAVALYIDGADLTVAVGESKASRKSGSTELTNAAGMFAKIDAAEYGVELRTVLAGLRPVIPPQYTTQVSDSLWRDRRCYLPFILHERPFPLDKNRPSLSQLKPSAAQKRLVAIRIGDFYDFFDAVADEMRSCAQNLAF
jgi:hypothetical protein